MNIFSLLSNTMNPSILFFALGFMIKLSGSKFSLPRSVSQFLSVYLLIAVGFKGGVSLVTSSQLGLGFFTASFLGIGLSFLMPFIAFFALKKTTILDSKTQAAVAAHYGSVSLVTFITATAFLSSHAVPFAGYVVAVLALMESPAIVSGLILAHRSKDNSIKGIIKFVFQEIKFDGGILILLGTFLIGILTGAEGLSTMSGFLVNPFSGLLAFFLFDMGLKVGSHLEQLKLFNFRLLSFGLYMPLVGALVALLACTLFRFDIGTTTLMMVLASSSSYIAVPAVLQVALPEAKAAIYLPLSLAITFPFNVVVGIPVYYQLAKLVLT